MAKPGHTSPVRSLAACHATPMARPPLVAARARVARLYPFLNFSIWMNEVQPYKSSQRLVKF
jgi:hypothetical protein